MTLDVEGVVNSGVGGKESLGRALRLEPLLLAFSSPDRTVGALGAIVVSQSAGLVVI